MKLMIIDDHDIALLFSQHIVSSLFQNVETILQPSGYSALHFLEEYAQQPQVLPHVILLDLDMPVVNGTEFLVQLRKFKQKYNHSIKVIILSGYDKKEELKDFIHTGEISKYILKPLTIKSFSPEEAKYFFN